MTRQPTGGGDNAAPFLSKGEPTVANVIPLRPGDGESEDTGKELAILEPVPAELATYDPSAGLRPAKRLHKPTLAGMKYATKRHARNAVGRLAYELVKGIPSYLRALVRWWFLGMIYGWPRMVKWLCVGSVREAAAPSKGKRMALFGRSARGGAAVKSAGAQAEGAVDKLSIARWVGFIVFHLAGYFIIRREYGDPFGWSIFAPAAITTLYVGQANDTKPAPTLVAPRPREDISVDAMNGVLMATNVTLKPRPNAPAPGRVQLTIYPQTLGGGTLCTWVLPKDCGKSSLDVLKQVERIAAAFNTPLDCFIMEPGRTPAEFTTWQAPRNPFAGPYKPHPLLGEARWNVFQPIPFGHTAMGTTVTTALVFTAFLVSAMPRRGKSFYARSILSGAVLDPIVEFIVLDCKPGHTWDQLRGFCKPGNFINGRSNESVEQMAVALERLVDELDAVGPRIPGSRITERVARDPRFGCPIRVIVFDEIQEALGNKDFGKRVHDALETLAKVAPAYGFVPFLLTQRPDADTLDSDIRSVLPSRAVLEVDNWRDSDMGLGGTNMHEYGYDASKITNRGVAYFRPDRDTDGQLDGDDSVRKVRAFDMSDDVWESICRVGLALRGLDPELAAPIDLDDIDPVEDEQLTAAELWERIDRYAPEAVPQEGDKDWVYDPQTLGNWLSKAHGLTPTKGKVRTRSRVAVERALDVPLGCLDGSEEGTAAGDGDTPDDTGSATLETPPPVPPTGTP